MRSRFAIRWPDAVRGLFCAIAAFVGPAFGATFTGMGFLAIQSGNYSLANRVLILSCNWCFCKSTFVMSGAETAPTTAESIIVMSEKAFCPCFWPIASG